MNAASSNAASAVPNEKLVQISLQLDESNLIKNIQSTVSRALQFVKQDVSELRTHVQRVQDDLMDIKREVLRVKDVSLRKVATTLTDVRSAVAQSRAGAKALLMVQRERRERVAALKSDSDDYDPLPELLDGLGDDAVAAASGGSRSSGADDVDVDAERIKSLELQCAKLREAIRHLTDDVTPVIMSTIHRRVDFETLLTRELLSTLGLTAEPSRVDGRRPFTADNGDPDGDDPDANRTLRAAAVNQQIPPSLVPFADPLVMHYHRRGGKEGEEQTASILRPAEPPSLLFTIQSVVRSRYLSPVSSDLDGYSRRLVHVEQSLPTKVERSELEAVEHAVHDVKGHSEAVQATSERNRLEFQSNLTAVQKELRQELSGKVNWVDLDRWKGSVNETMTRTKETVQHSQRAVSEMQLESESVRRSVQDLNEKVAELVVSAAPLAVPSFKASSSSGPRSSSSISQPEKRISPRHAVPSDDEDDHHDDDDAGRGEGDADDPQQHAATATTSGLVSSSSLAMSKQAAGSGSNGIKRKMYQAAQLAAASTSTGSSPKSPVSAAIPPTPSPLYYQYAQTAAPNLSVRVESPTPSTRAANPQLVTSGETPQQGSTAASRRPRSALLMRRV